nr:TRAP transporter small permease subunit [Gammaproteobacteria bacterium]
MTELVDQLPRALQGLVRAMLAFKSVLVVIACLIMAGTFFFVVIVRYGFEGDLFAYNEWLLMVCFWLFFMGGALGTYEGSHINADLLDYFTEDQRLRWLRKLVVTAIEVGVSVALVYWAVLMIYDEIESYLIPRGGILVGLLMMSFYSALHLYALIKTRPRAVQAVAD